MEGASNVHASLVGLGIGHPRVGGRILQWTLRNDLAPAQEVTVTAILEPVEPDLVKS